MVRKCLQLFSRPCMFDDVVLNVSLLFRLSDMYMIGESDSNFIFIHIFLGEGSELVISDYSQKGYDSHKGKRLDFGCICLLCEQFFGCFKFNYTY